MQSRKLAVLLALALTFAAAACGGDHANTNNANSTNANTTRSATDAPSQGMQPGPGDSEIRTETAGDVTTQTRTFKNANAPVEKVVVTTRGGKRTARIHYRSGQVREVSTEGDVERALNSTADALAAAGSEIGDKAEDVGGKAKDVGAEVGDKAEDAKDQTVKGAKAVGREAADKAEDVGDKAASGAKKAGKATVKGAKKAGGAIKDAVTP